MAAEAAVETIFRAAGDGYAGAVAVMLDEDPRLLSTTWKGETLLTRAVQGGHINVTRVLFEKGTDLDALNASQSAALHCSAWQGHGELASFLLSHGADPRKRGYMGQTALMYASFGGHAAVVRLLLRYLGGLGLDERAEAGWTAAWCACLQGQVDTLRILLLAGADHTIADNEGQTPRQCAQQQSRHHCAALIQWWEGELERDDLLHRARCLLEQQRQLPPSLTAALTVLSTTLAAAGPLPSYVVMRLRPRPLPTLELVCLAEQSEATVGKGKRKGQRDGESPSEEEKDATLKFVMHDLGRGLYIELLEGFHK